MERSNSRWGVKEWNAAIAGGVAGIVGTALGFPFDTIKTRMQTITEGKKGMGGAIGVSRKILKEGGAKAFYRGVGSPLAALTVLNIMNFSSYSYFRQCLGVRDKKLQEGGFEIRVAVAAALVGPLASLISTPFEMVKVQMQLDAKHLPNRRYINSLHAAYIISRQDGVLMLYRAHVVNTLREMVFLSTYFLVYEHTKPIISPSPPEGKNSSSRMGIALSGGLAGSIGWFVSFPFDSVKANIQGNALKESGAHISLKTWDVAKQLLQRRGIRGLYFGVGPSIARAFIVSASRFSAYEAVLESLSSLDDTR